MFYPDTVTQVTPTYADHVAADRVAVGEAVSVPNLNPYGAYSNVVVLTEDHYRPLEAFDTETLRDGLHAALDYIHAVFDADETTQYASINMNYLPPAGSSIVHPHLQTLVDDRGTTIQQRQTRAAEAYDEAHDQSYWAALVAEERARGDRYIGATGRVDWLAAFAPTHFTHIMGVVNTPGVPAPDDDVVGDLATGITRVLTYYAAEGLNSFNLMLSLRPDAPAHPPVVHLVSRSVFDTYYVSDAPFFTTLHDEGVADVPQKNMLPRPASTSDGAAPTHHIQFRDGDSPRERRDSRVGGESTKSGSN